jgi:hypothetical protein
VGSQSISWLSDPSRKPSALQLSGGFYSVVMLDVKTVVFGNNIISSHPSAFYKRQIIRFTFVFAIVAKLPPGLLKIFVYLLNGEGEEHVVAAAFHRTCP